MSRGFGLLGQTLGHSWSPHIHKQLGSYSYQLFEKEPDEVKCFIKERNWQGLNVTIPYKREAFLFADKHSKAAERLGVANTLVCQDGGTIFADNTDVSGFLWMLKRFCTTKLGGRAEELLAHKKVLVLGTGGASQAVRAALEDVSAEVVCISRQGSETYETLVQRHCDAALIVNTTPVGMYPHCPQSPLAEGSLEKLTSLKGVLDVIYNPSITALCLEAEKLSLPYESGLPMLVAQARFSSELFQNKVLSDDVIEKIEQSIIRECKNIVLIGMPGVGKTTLGTSLAQLLGKPFIDLDDAFTLEYGQSPKDVITHDGEERFRSLESELCARYGKESGSVIACGGGVVTRPVNYDSLHQNGRIIYLSRPLDELDASGRPLSQTKGIATLAKERLPLYESWSDARLSCTGDIERDVQSLLTLVK